MQKNIKSYIGRSGVANALAVIYLFFRIFPIHKNRVLFQNFKGKGYSDSPKYIAESLRKSGGYDLYWVTKDKKDVSLPKGIKPLKRYSIKYFYVMATARVWVSNVRFDTFNLKRKCQYYIQTWHGGLALKKLEYDSLDNFNEYYKKVMPIDNKRIDLMISNSGFCTKMYRNAFRYAGAIIEVGTPRNDLLINDRKEIYLNTRKKLSVSEKTKIILYAPTYRDDYSEHPYDIDLENLRKRLEKEVGGEWVVYIKLHHLAQQNSKEVLKQSDKIWDLTSYPDIQELICASDLVITDYSSVMFDALIAERPVLLYAKDIEKYACERGYYFNLKKLPFPLIKNNEDLKKLNIEQILKTNSRYGAFRKEVKLTETGNATKEVCKIIRKYCN